MYITEGKIISKFKLIRFFWKEGKPIYVWNEKRRAFIVFINLLIYSINIIRYLLYSFRTFGLFRILKIFITFFDYILQFIRLLIFPKFLQTFKRMSVLLFIAFAFSKGNFCSLTNSFILALNKTDFSFQLKN